MLNDRNNSYAEKDIEDLYIKQKGKCADCQKPIGENDYYCKPSITGLNNQLDDEIKYVRLLCSYCNVVSHTIFYCSLNEISQQRVKDSNDISKLEPSSLSFKLSLQ